MKHSFLCSLAVFLLALAARAVPTYLYFDVEAFGSDGWNYFDYARIGVADENGVVGYLTNVAGDETSAFLESTDRTSAIGWADITGYVDDNEVWFFAQAYDATQKKYVMDYSEEAETKTTYADLVAGNHIATSTTNPELVTMWTIPEPTTSLLLLMGLAGLALKRKTFTAS